MRRLPVYIIVDSSYSMRGKPVQYINDGFKDLLRTLKKDPMLIEILYLSIIEFNTEAKQVLQLSPLPECEIPVIEAGGRSNMGEALGLLTEKLREEINRPDLTAEIKGDYKPVIYLLTDGGSSDSWKKKLKELKKEFSPRIISFGTGNFHRDVLEELSGPENVVDLGELENGIPAFFKFVSQSIPAYSKSAVIGRYEDRELNINELGINTDNSEEEILL